MKPFSCCLGLVVASLADCVTPFRTPADTAHIALARGDSPVVRIEKIWLERKDGGPLVVRGYVVKRLNADDTTRTPLDVTLYDGNGNVLRASVEHFEPRQIRRRYRMPDSAAFRVALDPLPASTARIAVRAHEGRHS